MDSPDLLDLLLPLETDSLGCRSDSQRKEGLYKEVGEELLNSCTVDLFGPGNGLRSDDYQDQLAVHCQGLAYQTAQAAPGVWLLKSG